MARGELRDDDHFNRGYKTEGGRRVYFATFPEQVLSPDPERQLARLKRGQERYGIFCAPCHGDLADGQGMVALRADALSSNQKFGWLPPQNLIQPLYQEKKNPGDATGKTVGELFHLLSEGTPTGLDFPQWKMPPYKSQISVEDRWAIVMYLRALQRSQYAKPQDLDAWPAEVRNIE